MGVVVGRDGVPFTGTSYFLTGAGTIDGEHEYRDGMRWGVSRGWYASGSPEFEEHLEHGLLHGTRKEWNQDGSVAAEDRYEYGVRVQGRRWGENGALIEDFTLTEADPAYDTLTTVGRLAGPAPACFEHAIALILQSFAG